MNRVAPIVVCGCILAAALASPPAAGAACGSVKRAKPRAAERRVPGIPPLVIGDSTLLLAVEKLARNGFLADARGCRMWKEGLDVLRRRRRTGRLPQLTVMALGANWRISDADVERALALLGKRRVLALVTPRESGGGSGADARTLRRAARRHPRRVVLLDWVKWSSGKQGWFSGDGLHLSWSGVSGFVRMTRWSLRWADPRCRPHRVVLSAPPTARQRRCATTPR